MKLKICHIVLLVLGGFVGYKWYQHHQWEQLMLSGYCAKDSTYFDDRHTERELIDRAITYVLEHEPEGSCSSSTKECWDAKRYTTMEEFKKLNPNCCEVQPLIVDAAPEYYKFTLTGEAYRYVTVNYKRYYIANREPNPRTKYIVFDNCGGLKDFNDLKVF
ncbi:hypothetical protein RYD26_12525 [Pasteurellaceae bacterium LIM206]|nr:hypothetical protein [Pasteurellaceae bacterium LIM206]